MCYNMDAKNSTGSAVLAVEPCSFIHRSNRLGSALQFFPYTGRRKALTCLPEAEKHIEVIVVFNERVFHKIVFRSVRGEIFKTTEVKNPVQNRLMNPKPDSRLHGFQRFRVVENRFPVLPGREGFHPHLQIGNAGQPEQAIVLPKSAIPLEIPVAAFQHKLIGFDRSLRLIPMTVNISKGE